jgi:hypothetical protein
VQKQVDMEQDIHLYTDKEIAFVLNHTDWCLREKADYTSTIQSALLEYANTRRDVASVLDVLKGIVTLSGKGRPSVSDLFRIGTNCLKLETLPLEFLHEMNIQRRKLGLEQFPLSCFQEMTSSSSETASQKVVQYILIMTFRSLANLLQNTEMYMKRSSTQNRDGSRISYREGTVEESEESDSGKETKDADFIYNAPNARKVKVSTKRPEKLSTRTTTQANSLSHSSPYSQTFVRPSTTKAFPSYRTSTPVSTNKMGARRVIEMSDGSESQITYKNDRYHPNKRKKLHNDSPPVLAPVSSEKVREPTTILQQPQTSIVAQAQRRVQPRHVGLSAEDASTPRTTQPGTMEQRMTDMGDLIFMLINEQSRAGQTTTPEIKQRLKSMSRTMKRDPGNLRDTMIQDLTAADSQREKYQETLKSLIGHQDFEQNASFPIKPPHSELDTAWRSIRQGIKDAFGNEYPEESTPKGWAAGFIASRVEDLLKNSKKTFPPKKYIDEVKHYLDSPHTVQTLIGGFICSRVFTTPDPLCEGFYCPKEMKLYEAKMLSGTFYDYQDAWCAEST